jgi:hypothetical protein
MFFPSSLSLAHSSFFNLLSLSLSPPPSLSFQQPISIKLTIQGGKIMAEYVWIGGTGAVRKKKEREGDKIRFLLEVLFLLLSAFSSAGRGGRKQKKKKSHLHPLPLPPPPSTPHPPSLPRAPPQDLRCKSRTLDFIPKSPADLPKWNYDGSSCGQAPGDDSEVFLIPRAIYRDPFRGGDNILVMCDAYEPPKAGEEGARVLGG